MALAGCGVFGGDHGLKLILQFIAAAVAGVRLDVTYRGAWKVPDDPDAQQGFW